MKKDEANKEAKKIYDKWCKDKEEIEKRAKAEGTWVECGLDANNHLFKKLDEEVREKLRILENIVDEE